MALLQSTTISGSNANTGSLSITGSTMVFPIIESSLTGSFSGSGKMWVNADGQTLQYSVQTSLGTVQSPASFMGAWSAGGSLPTATSYAGSTGVQNAFLFAGGLAPGATNATKEYNGSAWSAGGNMSVSARSRVGGGLIDSAIMTTSGVPFSNTTEEYDGSSWSNGGCMIVNRGVPGGAGVQNAFFVAGGYNPTKLSTTEEYNGASWASGPDMIVGLREGTIGGAGTQNAGLIISGISTEDAYCGCTDHYDGTAWSLGNSQNTPRILAGAAGTQNAVSYFGGIQGSTFYGLTEEYNGISWVNGCNLITTRGAIAGGNGTASANATLAAGGYTPTKVTCTEEYTKDFIKPYTTCVWTSGGGMIVPRAQGAGGGTQNAGLVAAGATPGRVACTEEWDGNQWSVGGVLSTARSSLAGGGTLNAGWVAGGEPAGGTATEEYNGTSWAGGGSLASGGYGKRGGGPQTSAQVINGTPSRDGNQTYDGTTWSNATSMPTQRGASALTGTCAASIVYGGSDAPGTYLNYGITWNGSAWSQTGATNTCARGNQMGGTQNDALSFGGYNPANPNQQFFTEHYDGSAWSVQGNLSVASKYGQGAATSPAASTDSFYAGGYCAPGVVGNMQLFTAACSTTLCSNLPVWSGAAQLLSGVSYGGGFGTQNAAVVATGTDGEAYFGSQEYDGTSWVVGGTTLCQTGEGRGRGGAGTLTAGLLFGGFPTANWTEEYDGTSWTAGGAMINSRYGGGSSGTQNAGLAAGGNTPSTTSATEEYNGSSWSAGGALSTARYSLLSTGTQNDTVAAGGMTPTIVACTEEYNGSSWAAGGALNIVRKDEGGFQMFGEGAYDATYAGGRNNAGLTTNEEYNGSSWSFRPILPISNYSTTRVGTSTAGIMIGGRAPIGNNIKNTFEYNNNTNTCVGAWSFGGNLITARHNLSGGAGTQNAGLAAGGRTPSATTGTEEYDGSSWTAGGAMSIARFGGAVFGTQNAAVAAGYWPGSTTTEEYDGSSWSAGGAMITGRCYIAGAGIQNAGLVFGGAPAQGTTEEYNGSTWASGGALSVSRYFLAGSGTQNAGLAIGGYKPGTTLSCTEEYNGSSWTTGGAANNARHFLGASGTQNDSLIDGGQNPAVVSCVEHYDGVAWSNRTSKPKNIYSNGAAGTGTQYLSFGGYAANNESTTLEYNCTSNQLLGAGLQNWIGKVDFVTG